MLYRDIDNEKLNEIRVMWFDYWDCLTDYTVGELEDWTQEWLSENNYDITPSAIRKNLKSEWKFRKSVIEDEIDIDEKLASDYEKVVKGKHNLSREKLLFNRFKRNVLDSQWLAEKYMEFMEDAGILVDGDITSINLVNNTNMEFIFSDLHIGQLTKEEHLAIIDDSITSIFNILEANNTNQLDLIFLGDMLEGLIHKSQILSNKLTLMEQVVSCQELMIYMLDTLKKHNIVVDNLVFITEDNHSEVRPFGSGRGDFKGENLLHIISETLKIYCNNNEITYHCGDMVEFGGYTYCHGHQFKGKASVKRWQQSTGKRVVMGHLHDYYNDGELIIVPALTPSGDYATSLGYVTEPKYVIKTGNSFELCDFQWLYDYMEVVDAN